MTLNLTIKGAPATKKNHGQIITMPNGRKVLLPSPQFKAYSKTFFPQVPKDARMNIDMPCNLKCVYYMPTKRKVDLVNLLEATCDLLVGTHVLKDDCSAIVASHDGSRVRYDKAKPRVEIEIRPVAEGKDEAGQPV